MLADGAIGARFSPGGDRLYLTDLTGLGVYDVTDPGSPQIRWHLPLPRLDTALRGAVHLVDISDPDGPAIVASRPAVPGLTAYDVRDLSAPFAPPSRRPEELVWVCADEAVFAFDVSGGRPPRLVLGGPGQPAAAHLVLLAGLQRARAAAWHGRGGAIALYVSTATLWAAALAPVADTSGRFSPAHAERLPLSPIGEWDRPASWGRGPVPSPAAPA